MSLRGRLLVAEPSLIDPNFHRTVVYLIEHSEAALVLAIDSRLDDLRVVQAASDHAFSIASDISPTVARARQVTIQDWQKPVKKPK